MSRIEAVNPKEAIGETKELLDAVQQKLGIVPNFLRVFAHSPKALAAFLGLFENIGQGVLDPWRRCPSRRRGAGERATPA